MSSLWETWMSVCLYVFWFWGKNWTSLDWESVFVIMMRKMNFFLNLRNFSWLLRKKLNFWLWGKIYYFFGYEEKNRTCVYEEETDLRSMRSKINSIWLWGRHGTPYDYGKEIQLLINNNENFSPWRLVDSLPPGRVVNQKLNLWCCQAPLFCFFSLHVF